MIDDSAGPAAYAVLRERGRTLRWLEHGARSGSEHRLGDLFWAAIAKGRRRSLTRLEGWSLPHGQAGETLWELAEGDRLDALPYWEGKELTFEITAAAFTTRRTFSSIR